MTDKKDKALALYSGGLDSRLIIKLLKEKAVDVTAIHYRLPFISDKEINDDFLKKEKVDLKVIDCRHGKELQEYLAIMKKPKYGTGAGANPCIDCKIYMFERAKQFAKENGYDYLATGEVPGQRPMSQLRRAQEIINHDVDFPIVRPLAEMGIHGRSREQQMNMVKELGDFHYPTPGGGCLLCEKGLKPRFQKYLKYGLITENTLHLMNVGRHFLDEDKGFWFIVARDITECEILEKFDTVLSSSPRTPAVFYRNINGSENNEIIEFAKKLQAAYSTGQDNTLRKRFSDIKI
ncbi:MAG: hypothetical protein ACLFQM_03575 [Fidelibacterota bacterium]